MNGVLVPRYFFDTFHNEVRTMDTEGLEVKDAEAACCQAIRTLPFMALDALPDGPVHDFAVEIRDIAGRRLFRAALEFRSGWIDPEPPE